jgi:predicted RNase H-like nuclease (RuvC/YqgF family)
MLQCTYIVDYEGDRMYQLVKNPISDKWEDQTAQSIRKNYSTVMNCPCKGYLIENCDRKFKDKIYSTTNFNYFVSKHINSNSHTEWIKHKNEKTVSLESKTNKELVEQIEFLERENRKDKVEFRRYLELRDKDIVSLKDQINDKDKLITMLEAQIPKCKIDNLIDFAI